MNLVELKKYQVESWPVDKIMAVNKDWIESIKQHDPNWVLYSLKNNNPDIKKYIMSSKEYKSLHYQFQWCDLEGSDRMKLKFQYRKKHNVRNESYFDGSVSYEDSLYQSIYEEEE